MFLSNQGEDFYDKVDKTNDILKKRFDSQPIHKCIKTKMKSYNGTMKTKFHDKKIPESFHYICLLVISMDSLLKKMIKIIHKCF